MSRSWIGLIAPSCPRARGSISARRAFFGARLGQIEASAMSLDWSFNRLVDFLQAGRQAEAYLRPATSQAGGARGSYTARTRSDAPGFSAFAQ